MMGERSYKDKSMALKEELGFKDEFTFSISFPIFLFNIL